MDDIQKRLISVIVVVIILYMFIRSQPKHVPSSDPPKDVSGISKATETLFPVVNSKSDGYHRSYEKLTNFAGVVENFQHSIEPPIRRSSPIRGSRRYTNAGRNFSNEQGFITVI